MAADLRAHRREKIREVHDLWLTRGVLDDGFAISQSRGHKQIFRAGDRHGFADDARALETIRLGADVTILDLDIRAHGA
jgi:hypothetical protein